MNMERWSSWFKAPVLKTGVRVTVPWVRIPLSPPRKRQLLAVFFRLAERVPLRRGITCQRQTKVRPRRSHSFICEKISLCVGVQFGSPLPKNPCSENYKDFLNMRLNFFVFFGVRESRHSRC